MIKKLVFLLTGTAALASCVFVVRERPESDEWRRPGEYARTFSLDPGGGLSLTNIDGNVSVAGGQGGEVEVRAWRGDLAGNRVRIYAMKDIAPEVRVDRFDGGLEIRTGDESPDVDFSLKVPESIVIEKIRTGRGDIRISDIYGPVNLENGEGNVEVKNYSGSLRAVLEQGSIDAEVLDLRSDDEVRITVRRGDIVLRLEVTADASIEASAPRGRISSDFDRGEDRSETRTVFRLGNGRGAVIVLEALDGDVRILKTE